MTLAIMCDLDGVVADFCGAAAKVHGLDFDDCPAGEYDMESWTGLTREQLFAPLDNFGFWSSLPLFPSAKAFVRQLKELAPVTFVTQAVQHPTCWSGKRAWATDHFPRTPLVVVSGGKHRLARPSVVLVDDADYQVEAWREAGGPAVLYPRRWNSRHAEAEGADERQLQRLVVDEVSLALGKAKNGG